MSSEPKAEPKPGSPDWWRMRKDALIPDETVSQQPPPPRVGLWQLLHNGLEAPKTRAEFQSALERFPAWGDWTEEEISKLWVSLSDTLPKLINLLANAGGGFGKLKAPGKVNQWHLPDCPNTPGEGECSEECATAQGILTGLRWRPDYALLARFLGNNGQAL